MKHQYYFLSGCPRSGTTLLSSILQQNPKFHTDIASPLNGLMQQILNFYDDGFNKSLTPKKIKRIIENVVDAYYEDVKKPIIFDNNRCYTGKLEILRDLYPYTKVLVCVRSIPDILNSFENIYRKNMYKGNSNIYGHASSTIYNRCESLIVNDGVLGLALSHLKQGLHDPNNDMMMLIEYEDLVNDTENVLHDIYEFLEFEPFEHDLSNIKGIKNADKVDDELNLQGLHDIRPTISRSDNDWLIPYDLCERFSNLEYWRRLIADMDQPSETVETDHG